MAKKKVFVSFDYTNDKHYKYLLDAWDANKNMDFVFNDCSADEIQSYNIPTIKAGLTRRINTTTYTLVIVGKEANKQHRDHVLIGYKNWINFEVAKSKEHYNKLVAVKLDSTCELPDELKYAGAKIVIGFHQDSIIKALNEA